jgi:molybdopterin molybdotransferase
LPGNPVAVLVCFLMYAVPMLRRLAGGHWIEPRRFPLPASFDVPRRKTGRREFWRGILQQTGGQLAVEKYERDGSGLISGLRVADGLIEIAEDVSHVRRGDLVSFIPFSEFGILR